MKIYYYSYERKQLLASKELILMLYMKKALKKGISNINDCFRYYFDNAQFVLVSARIPLIHIPGYHKLPQPSTTTIYQR